MDKYDPKDVRNGDEIGLFFPKQSKWTLSNGFVAGRTVEKSRNTYLACCNRIGTDHLPLMVIGRSACPYVLKITSGQDLELYYHANLKAWMKRTLFFNWLT